MKNAKRIILYQIVTAVVLTGIGLLFGLFTALSVLIGAGASAVGTGILAWGIFTQNHKQDPISLLGNFYIAEALKIFTLTLIIITALVLIEEADPLALSGAYFINQFFPTALASFQDDDTDHTREN